jgi:hypothetical protein
MSSIRFAATLTLTKFNRDATAQKVEAILMNIVGSASVSGTDRGTRAEKPPSTLNDPVTDTNSFDPAGFFNSYCSTGLSLFAWLTIWAHNLHYHVLHLLDSSTKNRRQAYRDWSLYEALGEMWILCLLLKLWLMFLSVALVSCPLQKNLNKSGRRSLSSKSDTSGLKDDLLEMTLLRFRSQILDVVYDLWAHAKRGR